jgi:hypothetical protein
MTVQDSEASLLIECLGQRTTKVLLVEIYIAGQNAIAIAWQNRLVDDGG